MKMTRWRSSYAQMITEGLSVALESDVRVITTIKKILQRKKYTTLMITYVVVYVISKCNIFTFLLKFSFKTFCDISYGEPF